MLDDSKICFDRARPKSMCSIVLASIEICFDRLESNSSKFTLSIIINYSNLKVKIYAFRIISQDAFLNQNDIIGLIAEMLCIDSLFLSFFVLWIL